jgi:O-antigen/teichoic acid export membrane protein
MSDVSTYLRRGGLTLIAVGLGGFVADYALNVGLSRLLPPHEFGDYRVAREFAAFFSVAVLLGGDRAAPKALAGPLARGQFARAWEYIRFYLGLALGLSVVLIAATWGASWLHVGSTDPGDHHAVAWLVLSVPMLSVGALASRGLQSARRPFLAAFPWRVGFPGLILLLLLLTAWGRGGIELRHALIFALAATAVVSGVQWWQLRRLQLPELVRDPDVRAPRLWLQTSVPMMGAFLVTLALSQSDLYFLEWLGDEAEVGHYAAAVTTAHFLLLIQTTVVGLMAPLLQPALEEGAEATRSTLRQGQRLMLAGLLPAAVALGLAARPVLSLFGPGYPAADTVLVYLLVGNVTWAAAALSILWLQYTHRGTVIVAITATTLAVDSVLNALLIPRYGMDGAAAGTAVTMTLAALAVWVARRRP